MAALTRVLASGGEASRHRRPPFTYSLTSSRSLEHRQGQLSAARPSSPSPSANETEEIGAQWQSGLLSIYVCSAFSPSAVLIYSLSPLGRIDQSTSPAVSVTTGDKIASPTVAETSFLCAFFFTGLQRKRKLYLLFLTFYTRA